MTYSATLTIDPDHQDSTFDASHIDSKLTSLAHSSAIQAKLAASNQHTAGNQAAYQAKSSLAEAANGVILKSFINKPFYSSIYVIRLLVPPKPPSLVNK